MVWPASTMSVSMLSVSSVVLNYFESFDSLGEIKVFCFA